ncbi:MAG: ParB N-terminal domain-containing protein [Candidatus Bathyarchaeota archaeon]|nr:MAG: ParB N-terminal domain-containing protein [Candidatus Bathyarchaeota archaeon]
MVKEAFPIIHPKIKLEIKLEKVENLHIHEEVIPHILHKLTEDIRADNLFKHPVIVDSKTLVVLDGMHRVAATKNLGCRFIPVCLVEYDNPHIKVGCWCRVINHSSNLKKLVRSIRETGYVVEECQGEKARKLVNERKAIAAIMASSKCFAVYGPQKNIREIYEAIKQIELKLGSHGYSISYDTESDAQKKVSSGNTLSMLMAPSVSKKDVVEVALKREVFAHKTTRHVIPVRPLFVNVPLEMLKGTLTLKKVNEILVENLTKKQITRLPPGQIIDRRYEEELYVFE